MQRGNGKGEKGKGKGKRGKGKGEGGSILEEIMVSGRQLWC